MVNPIIRQLRKWGWDVTFEEALEEINLEAEVRRWHLGEDHHYNPALGIVLHDPERWGIDLRVELPSGLKMTYTRHGRPFYNSFEEGQRIGVVVRVKYEVKMDWVPPDYEEREVVRRELRGSWLKSIDGITDLNSTL
ncbi:hypothetical protein JW868_04165 [Candidatus Woesearchaeota archaeon]|nr:hypothetical protein [Candidatus Woesearchaeota archaeon]